MTSTPPAERVPLVRRPLFWLILAAALLAVALAAVVIVSLVSGPAPAPSASPTPSTTAPVASSEPATPPATDAPGTETPSPPVAVVIPASCDGIYTRDWAAELGGLVLNPTWSEAEPLWGSNDRGAVTMLEGTIELRCAWVQESGGGDVGLITNVASLTSEQQASMVDYFADAGFTCYEELEGTRCVIEEATEAGEWGESHFLREGIWIATRWANVSPEGYTPDMVAAIFG